ncbi:hypothetical protein JRQ81_012151 [Phrynocephalus forsythii]|uniref:Uncharacterized protein n=1 Tax=Phrynocephalus forsythii TaxID=171643 RepID=A0A9Q0X5C8_9SAUR|nr:hypothetical protein JRQ81_012151 [Phrynocephalus forsythii]
MDNSISSEQRDTFNYEATLDHASKLALIRKRKQREAEAARLDNTLSGFVEWVEENTSRKEEKMAARDEEQKRFHDEVIHNMRLASTSLARLTEYITASNCRGAGNSGACTDTVDNASVPSGTVKGITGGCTDFTSRFY